MDDLYLRNGIYRYSGGINYRALVALAVGIAVALLGLAVPALRWLYDYAWFVGFLVAGAAHFALMQREPVTGPGRGIMIATETAVKDREFLYRWEVGAAAGITRCIRSTILRPRR